MHVHILGICGTFMAGVAVLAKEAGHEVSGSDANVYPPMSTQLEQQGIKLMQGYAASNLESTPDIVVIGNALSRGNPEVEAVLEKGLDYTSGAQWLSDYILKDRWVLAVAGTHGKTTTASLLAWLLEDNNLSPGFLIGGIPANFGISARLGDTPFFVVEADEYDTAFFDKRSKFVHYHPRTLVLNNLEYDHADIFPDIDAIKTQFHHLIRTVPQNGLVINNQDESYLQDVLNMGCWTPVETFSAVEAQPGWSGKPINDDCSEFEVKFDADAIAVANWSQIGRHNMLNALAAIAAARHVGIPAELAVKSLSGFKGIKRRMEVRGEVKGVTVYDDFAHHPTAIETTLEGLRNKVGSQRIIAILEPRSNTMRMGIHRDTLADSLKSADLVYMFKPGNMEWNLNIDPDSNKAIFMLDSVEEIIHQVVKQVQASDHILVMSNGGFENIHQRLLDALQQS